MKIELHPSIMAANSRERTFLILRRLYEAAAKEPVPTHLTKLVEGLK
jgi:hypothetical protein